MRRRLSNALFLVSALTLISSLCGCADHGSPAPGPHFSPTYAGPTETAATVATPALLDPLIQARQHPRAMPGLDPIPLLHLRGRGAARYEIKPVDPASSYYVLINCSPASHFKINGKGYTGTCLPGDGGFAVFPAKNLGREVSVTVPSGTEFWLAITRKEGKA